MKENQQCALRPPKSARGGKRKLTAVLMSLLLIFGATSCGERLARNEVQAVYSYTIRAYYLDGGSRVITMKGYFPPRVACYKGSYWIETCYGLNGRNGQSENAVCRYDLLSKKDISEEHYGAKILSTRLSDGETIHTMDKNVWY